MEVRGERILNTWLAPLCLCLSVSLSVSISLSVSLFGLSLSISVFLLPLSILCLFLCLSLSLSLSLSVYLWTHLSLSSPIHLLAIRSTLKNPHQRPSWDAAPQHQLRCTSLSPVKGTRGDTWAGVSKVLNENVVFTHSPAYGSRKEGELPTCWVFPS